MKFIITQEEGDTLLKYLLERPYKEVANLVHILANLPGEKVKEEPKKVEAKTSSK